MFNQNTMIDKILKAFNPTKEVTPNGNKFTPRVQSTVKPVKVYDYNELIDNLYKQLKIKPD
jgi:hypothetical protein